MRLYRPQQSSPPLTRQQPTARKARSDRSAAETNTTTTTNTSTTARSSLPSTAFAWPSGNSYDQQKNNTDIIFNDNKNTENDNTPTEPMSAATETATPKYKPAFAYNNKNKTNSPPKTLFAGDKQEANPPIVKPLSSSLSPGPAEAEEPTSSSSSNSSSATAVVLRKAADHCVRGQELVVSATTKGAVERRNESPSSSSSLLHSAIREYQTALYILERTIGSGLAAKTRKDYRCLMVISQIFYWMGMSFQKLGAEKDHNYRKGRNGSFSICATREANERYAIQSFVTCLRLRYYLLDRGEENKASGGEGDSDADKDAALLTRFVVPLMDVQLVLTKLWESSPAPYCNMTGVEAARKLQRLRVATWNEDRGDDCLFALVGEEAHKHPPSDSLNQALVHYQKAFETFSDENYKNDSLRLKIASCYRQSALRKLKAGKDDQKIDRSTEDFDKAVFWYRSALKAFYGTVRFPATRATASSQSQPETASVSSIDMSSTGSIGDIAEGKSNKNEPVMTKHPTYERIILRIEEILQFRHRRQNQRYRGTTVCTDATNTGILEREIAARRYLRSALKDSVENQIHAESMLSPTAAWRRAAPKTLCLSEGTKLTDEAASTMSSMSVLANVLIRLRASLRIEESVWGDRHPIVLSIKDTIDAADEEYLDQEDKHASALEVTERVQRTGQKAKEYSDFHQQIEELVEENRRLRTALDDSSRDSDASQTAESSALNDFTRLSTSQQLLGESPNDNLAVGEAAEAPVPMTQLSIDEEDRPVEYINIISSAPTSNNENTKLPFESRGYATKPSSTTTSQFSTLPSIKNHNLLPMSPTISVRSDFEERFESMVQLMNRCKNLESDLQRANDKILRYKRLCDKAESKEELYNGLKQHSKELEKELERSSKAQKEFSSQVRSLKAKLEDQVKLSAENQTLRDQNTLLSNRIARMDEDLKASTDKKDELERVKKILEDDNKILLDRSKQGEAKLQTSKDRCSELEDQQSKNLEETKQLADENKTLMERCTRSEVELERTKERCVKLESDLEQSRIDEIRKENTWVKNENKLLLDRCIKSEANQKVSKKRCIELESNLEKIQGQLGEMQIQQDEVQNDIMQVTSENKNLLDRCAEAEEELKISRNHCAELELDVQESKEQLAKKIEEINALQKTSSERQLPLSLVKLEKSVKEDQSSELSTSQHQRLIEEENQHLMDLCSDLEKDVLFNKDQSEKLASSLRDEKSQVEDDLRVYKERCAALEAQLNEYTKKEIDEKVLPVTDTLQVEKVVQESCKQGDEPRVNYEKKYEEIVEKLKIEESNSAVMAQEHELIIIGLKKEVETAVEKSNVRETRIAELEKEIQETIVISQSEKETLTASLAKIETDLENSKLENRSDAPEVNRNQPVSGTDLSTLTIAELEKELQETLEIGKSEKGTLISGPAKLEKDIENSQLENRVDLPNIDGIRQKTETDLSVLTKQDAKEFESEDTTEDEKHALRREKIEKERPEPELLERLEKEQNRVKEQEIVIEKLKKEHRAFEERLKENEDRNKVIFTRVAELEEEKHSTEEELKEVEQSERNLLEKLEEEQVRVKKLEDIVKKGKQEQEKITEASSKDREESEKIAAKLEEDKLSTEQELKEIEMSEKKLLEKLEEEQDRVKELLVAIAKEELKHESIEASLKEKEENMWILSTHVAKLEDEKRSTEQELEELGRSEKEVKQKLQEEQDRAKELEVTIEKGQQEQRNIEATLKEKEESMKIVSNCVANLGLEKVSRMKELEEIAKSEKELLEQLRKEQDRVKELELLIEEGNQVHKNMEANLKNLADREESEKSLLARISKLEEEKLLAAQDLEEVTKAKEEKMDQIQILRARILELEKEADDSKTGAAKRNQHLCENISKLEVQVKEKDTEKELILSQLHDIESANKEVEKEYELTKFRCTELERKLEDTEKTMNDKKELCEQISKLEDKLELSTKEKFEISSEIRSYEERLKVEQENSQNAIEEHRDLLQRYSLLEKEVKVSKLKLNKNAANTERQITNLNKSIDELKSEKDSISEDMAELKGDMDQLRQKNTKLSSEVDTINDLRSTIESTKQERDNAKKATTKLETELGLSKEEHKREETRLNKVITDLEDELESALTNNKYLSSTMESYVEEEETKKEQTLEKLSIVEKEIEFMEEKNATEKQVLHDNIDELEKELELAFKKHNDEKEVLEQQVSSLEKALVTINKSNEKLLLEIESCDAKMNELQLTLESGTTDNGAFVQKISALQKEVVTMDVNNKDLVAKNESISKEAKELKKKLAKSKKDEDGLVDLLANLESALESSSSKNKELSSKLRLAEKERANLESTVKENEVEHQDLIERVVDLQKELESKSAENVTLSTKITDLGDLKKENESLTKRLSILEDELKSTSEKNTHLSESIKSFKDFETDQQNLESSVAELKKELQSSEETNRQLSAEMESKNESLTAEKESSEYEKDELIRQISDLEIELESSRTSEQYLIDDAESMKRQQAEHIGRISELVSQFEASKESNATLAANMKRLKEEQISHLDRISDLEMELQTSQATNKILADDMESLKAQKQENQSSMDQILTLEKELDDTKEKNKSLVTDIEFFQRKTQEYDQMRDKVSTLEEDIEKLNAELIIQKENYDSTNANLNRTEEERKALQIRCESREKELQELSNKIDTIKVTAEKEEKSFRAKSEEDQKEMNDLRTRCMDLEDQVKHSTEENREITSLLRQKSSQIKSLSDSFDESEDFKQKALEFDNVAKQCLELEDELVKTIELNEEMTNEISALKQEIAALNSNIFDTELDLSEQEKELENANKSNKTLARRCSSMEKELKEIKFQYEKLEKKIAYPDSVEDGREWQRLQLRELEHRLEDVMKDKEDLEKENEALFSRMEQYKKNLEKQKNSEKAQSDQKLVDHSQELEEELLETMGMNDELKDEVSALKKKIEQWEAYATNTENELEEETQALVEAENKNTELLAAMSILEEQLQKVQKQNEGAALQVEQSKEHQLLSDQCSKLKASLNMARLERDEARDTVEALIGAKNDLQNLLEEAVRDIHELEESTEKLKAVTAAKNEVKKLLDKALLGRDEINEKYGQCKKELQMAKEHLDEANAEKEDLHRKLDIEKQVSLAYNSADKNKFDELYRQAREEVNEMEMLLEESRACVTDLEENVEILQHQLQAALKFKIQQPKPKPNRQFFGWRGGKRNQNKKAHPLVTDTAILDGDHEDTDGDGSDQQQN